MLTEHGVKIAPSTNYEHLSRTATAREQGAAYLLEQICRVRWDSFAVYGARKVWLALNREGIAVARCVVERLMRLAGLVGARRGKVKKTTVADPDGQRVVDLVARRFAPTAPDRLWVADIKCRRRHESSTHRQVYGYAKDGAAVGRHQGKKTLHPLIATVSTPIARPVVAGIRPRRGKSADVRGAARFLAETLAVVRQIAPTPIVVVRADSKFYTADTADTAARYDAFVSVTTGANPSVNTAITTIPDTAWTPIHYPQAFVDAETGELTSDAHVAQIPYTARTPSWNKSSLTPPPRPGLGVPHHARPPPRSART